MFEKIKLFLENIGYFIFFWINPNRDRKCAISNRCYQLLIYKYFPTFSFNNSKLLPEIQLKFFTKGENIWDYFLVKYPNLCPEAQMELANTAMGYIREMLTSHPNLTDEVAYFLCQSGVSPLFISENTNPNYFRYLFLKHKDYFISYIMDNPHSFNNFHPEIKKIINHSLLLQ